MFVYVNFHDTLKREYSKFKIKIRNRTNMKLITSLLILSVLFVFPFTTLAKGNSYKTNLLVTVNNKTKSVNGNLKFDAESLTVKELNKPATAKEFKYSEIVAAEYSYAKKPILNTGGAIATAVLIGVFVVPLLFMKKKQHWLAIRTDSDFVVLRLERKNHKAVITELETNGVEVTTATEENSKKKDKSDK